MARFAQVVVPLKLLLFLVALGPLLVLYAGRIPEALALVFQAAFTPEAALGGAAGYSLFAVINAGLGRGIFANEAGLGSAAIAHAQAQVDHPVRQGFWGVTEMLVSFLVTSLTALTFVASGLWREGGGAAEAAQALFQAHPLGGVVLALTVAVFALGTMVSWGFYGEEAAAFLLGEGVRWPYRLAFATLAFVGPLGASGLFGRLRHPKRPHGPSQPPGAGPSGRGGGTPGLRLLPRGALGAPPLRPRPRAVSAEEGPHRLFQLLPRFLVQGELHLEGHPQGLLLGGFPGLGTPPAASRRARPWGRAGF